MKYAYEIINKNNGFIEGDSGEIYFTTFQAAEMDAKEYIDEIIEENKHRIKRDNFTIKYYEIEE